MHLHLSRRPARATAPKLPALGSRAAAKHLHLSRKPARATAPKLPALGSRAAAAAKHLHLSRKPARATAPKHLALGSRAAPRRTAAQTQALTRAQRAAETATRAQGG